MSTVSDLDTPEPKHRGVDILRDPRLNKMTRFSQEEREALGLMGLVPEGIDTETTQVQRVLHQINRKPTDLGKYIYLTALLDNDETLFFRVLMSDPARFMPLVYTPTVGEACQQFGHILRRPAGCICLSSGGPLQGNPPQLAGTGRSFHRRYRRRAHPGPGRSWCQRHGHPHRQAGAYTACAGVPPQVTMPIPLDVGTNNESLLNDPLYLGLRQPRVRGDEYDAMVEDFVAAVQDVFPKCCIQFEDFANIHSVPILARYRDRVCCFNDDIQGTAAVAVAGIFGALRTLKNRMTDQTFLFLGAGSAGPGSPISDQDDDAGGGAGSCGPRPLLAVRQQGRGGVEPHRSRRLQEALRA